MMTKIAGSRRGEASALGLGLGLTLGLVGPASAQDFCGGASAGGQWIGGNESASDVATASAYMEQMALVLMQAQYVALFSVSASTDVRVEAQGRGAGDPVITLTDESGAVVLSDDDSGGNGAARAESTLQPGRYCLSMTSFDGSPMTGFVRVGRTDQQALTTGLTTEPPPPAPPPETSAGTPPETDPIVPTPGGQSSDTACLDGMATRDIGQGGPVDPLLTSGGATATASVEEVPSWGFTLAAPAAVSITAENTDADPIVTLYDGAGNYLGENDDFDGLNSRLDMPTPLAAGTYCVAMSALSDTTLPIAVAVVAYDPMAAQVAMYERGEASPPLDGSYPVTALGPLASRLRTDVQSTDTTTWFSFEVAEPGLVLVEAVTNGTGDPMLMLFDDFGREIAYNDDNGDTLNSLVTARVSPGTYVVGVRQLGEGTQSLTRMLFERFVPAK